MPPGEFSSRPPSGRPPLPRNRMSLDGISQGPPRPSQLISNDQRQRFTRRPPESAQLPAQPESLPVPLTPLRPQAVEIAASARPSMAARTIDFAVQQSQPVPVQPPVASMPPVPAQTLDQPDIKDFAPPPKVPKQRFHRPKIGIKIPKPKRPARQLMPVLIGVIGVLLIGAGGYSFLHWQSVRNNPDRIFADALQASMKIEQVQTDTTSPQIESSVIHDYGNAHNPVTSTKGTIHLAGAAFGVAGYGSARNTYLSYTKLPNGVAKNLSSQLTNGWVQLRSEGVQPLNIGSALAQVTDPRAQNFGPVVMANLPDKTRSQTMAYIAKNRIYRYDVKKVSRTKIGDTKVLVYKIKLNVDSLKIINQSAALAQGFAPAEFQAAANALEVFRDSDATFYIDTKTHRFKQIDSGNGQNKTSIAYSQYNQVAPANEPQTNLKWATFSPIQYQMETQVAALQSPADRDAARQAQLAKIHTALASYFGQTNAYPSFANLNNPEWVSVNLNALDPEVLRDPLSPTLTLSPTARAGSFAYETISTNPKVACDNVGNNLCTQYKLTATLTNNKFFIVQDP